MREILVKARDQLAGCPCQGEARAACHRCLLGVVRPVDVPSASRRVALNLLADLLDDWAVEEITTVGAIDIAPVQLSELELVFRESVKAWLDTHDGCSYDTALGTERPAATGDLRLPTRSPPRPATSPPRAADEASG